MTELILGIDVGTWVQKVVVLTLTNTHTHIIIVIVIIICFLKYVNDYYWSLIYDVIRTRLASRCWAWVHMPTMITPVDSPVWVELQLDVKVK